MGFLGVPLVNGGADRGFGVFGWVFGGRVGFLMGLWGSGRVFDGFMGGRVGVFDGFSRGTLDK